VPGDEWAEVERKLREIGLDPKDVRAEHVAGFKEWLLKKGLSPSSVNTYVCAVTNYIKRSNASECLKRMSAFRNFKEYVDQARRSDDKRRLMALAAELARPVTSKMPVRITRYNYVGYLRAKVLEILYTKGPMNVHQLALEMSMAANSLRGHLLALAAGGYVCDRLIDRESPRIKVYAVCPSCPLRDECDAKHEMKWQGAAR